MPIMERFFKSMSSAVCKTQTGRGDERLAAGFGTVGYKPEYVAKEIVIEQIEQRWLSLLLLLLLLLPKPPGITFLWCNKWQCFHLQMKTYRAGGAIILVQEHAQSARCNARVVFISSTYALIALGTRGGRGGGGRGGRSGR